MSVLHALAWHVEIKAAACDREASTGPSKAFGFISAVYVELISGNQSLVVFEDLRSQGNRKKGRGGAGKFKRTHPLGARRMAAEAELFVPMAAEEEGEKDASPQAASATICPTNSLVFPSLPPLQ